MKKKLLEMSLNELWQLFPIELSNPKSGWRNYYEQIRNNLKLWLTTYLDIRISHIGSTAIKDIKAKNIIDVLVEFPVGTDLLSAAELLEKHGCIIMNASKKRVSLNRGYTPKGFSQKVYHIHLRYYGDNDELYFRDYLNQFPEIAQQYEHLKETLAVSYRYNRDRYTNEKSDFVQQVTQKAKKIYGAKYEK